MGRGTGHGGKWVEAFLDGCGSQQIRGAQRRRDSGITKRDSAVHESAVWRMP